jgi:hypothetical protein
MARLPADSKYLIGSEDSNCPVARAPSFPSGESAVGSPARPLQRRPRWLSPSPRGPRTRRSRIPTAGPTAASRPVLTRSGCSTASRFPTPRGSPASTGRSWWPLTLPSCLLPLALQSCQRARIGARTPVDSTYAWGCVGPAATRPPVSDRIRADEPRKRQGVPGRSHRRPTRTGTSASEGIDAPW